MDERDVSIQDLQKSLDEVRADRDLWRSIAMKEHAKSCHLNDHDLCVDYLDWHHSLKMRGAL